MFCQRRIGFLISGSFVFHSKLWESSFFHCLFFFLRLLNFQENSEDWEVLQTIALAVWFSSEFSLWDISWKMHWVLLETCFGADRASIYIHMENSCGSFACVSVYLCIHAPLRSFVKCCYHEVEFKEGWITWVPVKSKCQYRLFSTLNKDA